MKQIAALLFALLFSSTLSAADKKMTYDMFPQAKEGYTRYVIEVPEVENPYDHKVELLIGKMMMVDCNHASLSADITEQSLKGWGYSYLEVSHVRQGPTTMRMCKEPKVEKYITITAAQKTLRRYNSRLGIVVYVPKTLDVRYRIWSASDTVQEAEEK